MYDFITQTITRSIDTALTQWGILAPLSAPASARRSVQPLSHLDSESSHTADSPSLSHHGDHSLLEDDDAFDFNLSGEEEEISSNQPHNMGLFLHERFKTLLHKAWATANMGTTPVGTEGSSNPQDSTNLLFTEAIPDHDSISSPKPFLDMV